MIAMFNICPGKGHLVNLFSQLIINMQKKVIEIDIINDLLEECIMAYPISSFIISLYKQYRERGSLSKKQLQGLHSKAAKVKDMPQNKLATLEAIIKKMPTRDKSPLPPIKPLSEKDESTGYLIKEILDKYPQHKRVLFLKAKYENNELLSSIEVSELKKFKQLLK
jgi:hypothetical protein